MRLSKVGDASAAAALLRHAFDRGITAFHCSSEYETFPLLCTAWEEAGLGAGAAMIAKLAVPHFREDRFSASAFRAKVDFYLDALSIERLEVVQWLLRYDLKQEEGRLRILSEAAGEIGEVVAELKQSGKIGSCVGFPYTAGVADGLLRADYCDGLALYVNPLEREMEPFIEEAGRVGKLVVAIRPFAAGRLFAEKVIGADEALDYVLGFEPVMTTVVSASSRDHIDALARHLPRAGA